MNFFNFISRNHYIKKISLSIFKYINEKDPSIYVPLCLDKAIKSNVLGKKNKTSILDVLDKIDNK